MDTTLSSIHSSTIHEDIKMPLFLRKFPSVPQERAWLTNYNMHQYQGFWYETTLLMGAVILQKRFQSQPSDVLLASYPKSGTTWLTALVLTIMNRQHLNDLENPLLKANPHELFTFLESYALENPSDPRPASSLLSTHIPYISLADSIKTSARRIVYVFRDPKDVLVSLWHFTNKVRPEELPSISMAEAFEQFSRGVSPYGPIWDHIMGYWKASRERPDKILLLSYEELKQDPCFHVKRLAQFLGHTLSLEEEKDGLVSKIVQFCSFENLSNLDVNKTGTQTSNQIEKKSYFRKGKVGDAKNHLSEEMMLILDEITKEKLKDLWSLTTVDTTKDGNSVADPISDQKEGKFVGDAPSAISTSKKNAH